MRSGRSGGKGRSGGSGRGGGVYGLGEHYWNHRALRDGLRAVGYINSSTEEFAQDTEAAWAAICPLAKNYQAKTLPTKSILDFGAGWGRFSKQLAEFGDVYAVDGSIEMCRLSCGRVKHAPAGKRLPFVDNFFTGGLFCYTVLQHITDNYIDWQCYELRRVLGPGSYMIVCDAIGSSSTAYGHSTSRSLKRYQKLLPGLKQKPVIIRGICQPTLLAGWKA